MLAGGGLRRGYPPSASRAGIGAAAALIKLPPVLSTLLVVQAQEWPVLWPLRVLAALVFLAQRILRASAKLSLRLLLSARLIRFGLPRASLPSCWAALFIFLGHISKTLYRNRKMMIFNVDSKALYCSKYTHETYYYIQQASKTEQGKEDRNQGGPPRIPFGFSMRA
jgi:hypothetical protein